MANRKKKSAQRKEDEVLVQRYLQKIDAMTVGELRDEHLAIAGVPTRSRNKAWLRNKVLQLAQEQAEGGLTAKARMRIQQLLALDDVVPAVAPVRKPPPMPKVKARQAAPRTPRAEAKTPRKERDRDPRLPRAGTVISRKHKGKLYEVKVNLSDFTFNGARYTSLSTIAREIAGTPWNGFTFFGLSKTKRKAG